LLLGSNIAAAEMIMLWGGRVKFVDDDIWYKSYSKGDIPIPKEYNPNYIVEAVDLSNTQWMLESMEHFRMLMKLVTDIILS